MDRNRAMLRAGRFGRERARRGFTVVELIFVVVIVVLVLIVLMPALTPPRRGVARQIKDGTQVRGVHQGMVLFANNNNDKYPLPSLLDVENFTVDAPAASKDTTGHIMSVLVYQNFFTPELLVSPSEVNPAILVDHKFEYTAPSAAVNPAKALWDPGFNADFTEQTPKRIAGFSYGHRLPAGAKLEAWSNSFNSNDAMVGNRGPLVTGVKQGTEPQVQATFNKDSLTLLIHGGRNSWEGNVAYNDNSIMFETKLAPEDKTWSEMPAGDTSGKKYKSWRDVLFFDEKEDPNGTNNYLVNVKKVGEAGAEMIWD